MGSTRDVAGARHVNVRPPAWSLADERFDAARVARAWEARLEAGCARLRIARAARFHERLDRDHLALLNEEPTRERLRVLIAERQRFRWALRPERILRPLEELHLGLCARVGG